MNKVKQLPLSLISVATLFILAGCSAAFVVLEAFLQGTLLFHIGLLWLFIGSGLLALDSRWRTCALVTIWMVLIGVPIYAAFKLSGSGSWYYYVCGQQIGDGSKGIGLAMAISIFLLSLWQYRVLTRRSIRNLFESQTANEKEFAADRGASDCNSWLKRSHCFGGYWRLHSRGLSVPNAGSG
jgi:hypothetical protein